MTCFALDKTGQWSYIIPYKEYPLTFYPLKKDKFLARKPFGVVENFRDKVSVQLRLCLRLTDRQSVSFL